MNRRKFLKLLGIGIPAVLIAPDVFALKDATIVYPVKRLEREVWYAPAGFNRGSIDNINRRRSILEIKKAMEETLEFHRYELNDHITRESIQSLMGSRLNIMRQQRLIGDYVAICNDANNPPIRIDQGFLNLDVSVEFSHDASHVNLVATMVHSGVSITEFGKSQI